MAWPPLVQPASLLLCRLKAYRKWLTMEEPDWSDNRYPRIDYQDLSYYSAPKQIEKKGSLDEVRPSMMGLAMRGGRAGSQHGAGLSARAAGLPACCTTA